jgi:cyclic pyranopterin monophosphate synthase
VRLYHFDGIDDRLELLPLAARRALDRAGLKLSLEGWRSLSLESRRTIVEAGSAPLVDVVPVRHATARAEPQPARIDPIDEPTPDVIPAEIKRSLGPSQELGDAVWSALAALDRYALAKLAARGRPERLSAAYAEIVGHSATATHVGPGGEARMVDVGAKQPSARSATAETLVRLSGEALERLRRADAPKGDVLGTARLAGIMAAKRTPDIVPLCHPVALTRVTLDLELDESSGIVRITAAVDAFDRTGVEMEALHAVSAAALTVYDMLKAFDRTMEIGPTRLLSKSGGRSGDFRR